jgi:hypothetical protein
LWTIARGEATDDECAAVLGRRRSDLTTHQIVSRLTQNPERSEGPRCASRAVYLTGLGFHHPQTHQRQRH